MLAKTEPVIESVNMELIGLNRIEIDEENQRKRLQATFETEMLQWSQRRMLFFPMRLLSEEKKAAARQRKEGVYSLTERGNVLVRGVQIYQSATPEEEAAAIFNRRVRLIQRAVDMKNADALLRVIFDSKQENEEEFDPQRLVDEAIQYCNLKRYFRWSSDLFQCGTTFQYSDKARFNFNYRVMRIHNAIDTDNVASLVSVIFDSKLQDEKIVDVESLVKEAIQYCAKTGRRHLLPLVLPQFLAVFPPMLGKDDYNHKIQKIAEFMGCNLPFFRKILPLFDHINRLDSVEDTLKESWPLNRMLLEAASHTQETIQKKVMHFLTEIIEPVSRVDLDIALQVFVDLCMTSIDDFLLMSPKKEISEPYAYLMGELDIIRGTCRQCTASPPPPSEGGVSSENNDILNNDIMISPTMTLLTIGGGL